MTKKKGLGKGLAALIGEAEDPNLSKSEIKEINESKSNEKNFYFLIKTNLEKYLIKKR